MLYNVTNPHGGDIYEREIKYDFSSNINPFGTPDGVKKAMIEAIENVNHYPDPYCRKLILGIADFWGVDKDYILCGNGAAEIIYSFCVALKPKSALEMAPTFSEYSLGLERVNVVPKRYELKFDNDLKLDEGILDCINENKPEVVFLCNPNNPTGKTIAPELLVSILECCTKIGSRLFVDECFLDLCDERNSLKDYLGKYKNLFILKAFTKDFGIPGVRLGFGLSSDKELLTEMSKAVQPWNVSVLAQAAGTAAIKEEDFVVKARELVKVERAFLKENLESFGYWVCDSKANYLLFKAEKGLDVKLKEMGIAIRNCSNYCNLTEGYYRIAVRLHHENEALIEGIKACKEK